MTLLCIAPASWFSARTDDTTGPVYREICHATAMVVEDGLIGYVIEGYGEEPFDAALFVEWVGVAAEEQKQYEYA